MIVLRKLSKAKKIVLSGELVGDINGVNKVFTTPEYFNMDNIVVTINGQQLYKDVGFNVTGPNEITFIYFAPRAEDILSTIYEVV